MQKRSRNVAIGALIAAGIGYGVGVLTAPKSGRETRKDIQRKALQAKTEAEKRLKEAHSELTKLIDQSKRKTKTATKTAKVELETVISKAQIAKQKVREVLSALHEGDAEDADLQKAINEATKSIDHLRNYLTKSNGKKATK